MTAGSFFAGLTRFSRPPAASVWLIGTAEAIDAAYAAVDGALRRHPGETLAILVEGPGLLAVRRRLPHEIVVNCPAGRRLERSIEAASPRLLIRLGEGALASVVGPVLAVPKPDSLDEADVLAALSRLPEKPDRSTRRSPWTEPLVRLAAGRPISALDDLKHRLGTPAAILCLGNGPSSEDPAITAFGEASLFRVNWIWRERGHFTRPDLVFTADPDLPDRDHRPILAFPRRRDGLPIAARHILHGRGPRAGYLFCDELEPTAAEIGADPIPTNGALMIAIAAALKPKRLGIAGIDLYRHPAGRYPGDGQAIDGYARQHRIELDLDLIRRSLASFEGEVVIFGTALQEALAEPP